MVTRLVHGFVGAAGWHRLRPALATVLAALVSTVMSGCAPTPSQPARTAAAKPPRRVVFLGDSLTLGLYATTNAQSFPSLVVEDWHASSLSRVSVRGVGAPALLGSVASLKPGASDVVVELGTNDFADNLAVADFDRAYRALVTAVRRREPGARFTCLGQWRGNAELTPSGQSAAAYDAIVSADCPGRFVALADLFLVAGNRGPANRPTFAGLSDTFHPNDTGHAAIAGAIDGVRHA